MSHSLLRTFCAAWLSLAYVACGTTEQQVGADDATTQVAERDGTDIQQALSALRGVTVLSNQRDATPDFIRGPLGQASGWAMGLAPGDAKATVQAALSSIAPIYRLRVEDLVFQRVSVDELGHQHLRFSQLKNGLPVIGGELILHVDRAGNIYAANGSARDTRSTGLLPAQPRISAEAAAVAARNATAARIQAAQPERLVYVRDGNDQLVLAHEVRVTGMTADGLPVNDRVYVDASSGQIVRRVPQIFTAKNRRVYSANNGSVTPGTLKRSEGQAAIGDTHVDTNYNVLGSAYDCFMMLFGVDLSSYTGGVLISTVHYGNNYVNAYWDGTQMVFGDGDGVNSTMLGLDMDVAVHELMHAVTAAESGLIYSGESGGLNEAMSDTAAAFCESWTRGFVLPDPEVWMIGEDIWTPGSQGDALRYMDDPAKDGSSLDWYPNYNEGVDVHYSSGIANLAFALLAKGGVHPRGRSSTVVPGIGVKDAGLIWFRANTHLMTSSTTFAQAKTCTEQAAAQLGYDQATIDAVTAAWQAVGVGLVIPPPPTTPLSNGVPVTGIGASTGTAVYYKLTVPSGQASLQFTISGGAGDADLYVKYGAAPTRSSYDCRPYAGGNSESCSFTNPAAGDWYVMLNAYSTYSGVTLTGTYGSGGGGGDTLTNGVATAPYSGASGSWTCWTLTVPAGKSSVVFNQAGATGNTGDADLYVRYNAAPTTSTYNCRPYLSGNTETCTISSPSAGTWYACSRGYSAYTQVTMKGTY
ncbi:MAG: M4 family metallopeptidase [Myxococcaceae bacterium]|nr:M4 family metallopeptidase [Myxococcaceae bacterium]